MEYFIKILAIVVWPAVILSLVLGFRHELVNLLGRLSSVKAWDLEAKFDKGLHQAEALAATVRRSGAEQAPPSGEPTLYAQLMRIAEVSPRAAISEAWRQVEAAASEAVETGGLKARPQFHVREVVHEAIRQGIFSPDARALFDQLHQLRNEAVHAPEFQLDQAEVARYVELALRLEQEIFHAGNALGRSRVE